MGAVAALHKNNQMPFDGADLMTLSTLAAAAAIVVGTHTQQAERSQQKRELDVLYEAVRNVSSALSASDVLRVVVEQIAAQMESSAVVVWLVSDGREHLSIAEDEGLMQDEREVHLPLTGADAEAWANATLTQTKSVFLQFAEGDDFPTPFPSVPISSAELWKCVSPFPALGARAGLACPIRTGERVRGLVQVLSGQKPGVYQKSDARLLAALCSQAAVALENADLYEDANRRADEAAVLYELSQVVAASLPLPDVLSRVADAVVSLLHASGFALFLHDKPTDMLPITHGRGLPPHMESRYAPQVGQGIIGWVMEFETPAAVQDVPTDPRNTSAPMDSSLVSLLAMPLQTGSQTIGVLCAFSTTPRHFTVAETELAYTLANQAALAIENARIYEQVRQTEAATRRFFGRLGRALSSARDPEICFNLMVSQAMETMGADRCALYGVEKSEGVLEVLAECGFRTEAHRTETQAEFSADTPAHWIIKNKTPLFVENLSTDDRFAQTYVRPAQGRAAGYLGVPLRGRGGYIVGTLEVLTRHRKAWSAAEVRLLVSFANRAAQGFADAQEGQRQMQRDAQDRCLSRLHEQAANGSLLPDAFVAALAFGLSVPVVLLDRQKGRGAEWEIAGASLAAGSVPLSEIRAALGEKAQVDLDLLIAAAMLPNGASVALAVLEKPAAKSEQCVVQSLMEAALSLFTQSAMKVQSLETPGEADTSK